MHFASIASLSRDFSGGKSANTSSADNNNNNNNNSNKLMDEETSTKATLMSTISRLKRQVALERLPYVKDKIEANSDKLKRCVQHHLNSSTARASRNSSQPENNMLGMRIQKALSKFGGDADDDGVNPQDDSSAPIVVGSTSGSKSVVKPVRLQAAPKIPPYTTWIFLDRNQRMAEDQSVVGRRRIYYGSSGNEALICSDSEEEQLEDEEEKREFSKGDDYVIRLCVEEHGSSKIVWKTLAECLQAKSNEVEARYKIIIKEAEDRSQRGENLENEKFQDLSSAMDSFDNLFCRRCLVFDCRLHGCSQPLVIPCEKQPPSNKQLARVPCGPCCFHLPTQGSSSAALPEIDAAKRSTQGQVDNNVTLCPENAPIARKVDKVVTEAPKRVFIDKSVNALRKLLKRKTRPLDEDTTVARKKQLGEPSSTETAKCDQPSLLKKLIAKKLVKMKMGSQLNRTKRPLPAKAKEEEVQVLGKEVASNWNAYEKGLYETGLQMFGRDSCCIARNLLKDSKTCAEVGEFMQLDRWRPSEETNLPVNGNTTLGVNLDGEIRSRRLYGRRRGKVRKLKYTWKSVGPSLRKRLDGKEGCKQYTPCSCSSTCGKQCSCIRNGTCCEKYCGCSKACKNRFRGCHCAKSQCSSRQCPCFAAGRECDPDVCRNCCVGCGDGTLGAPPSQDSYLCRNMKLLLKQQQRVLLGKSDVAGWGAFLKAPVNKHDYLGEYTGELISHHEADKRGKIYDRENSSFLFNLNDQYVLDACRRGDKLKFANHSPNPNCYAKVIMVAGDHRVGIFANERISAGDELFYDYRYEADRAPPWARKPEDSNKHDESASGSRRAQKTA